MQAKPEIDFTSAIWRTFEHWLKSQELENIRNALEKKDNTEESTEYLRGKAAICRKLLGFSNNFN